MAHRRLPVPEPTAAVGPAFRLTEALDVGYSVWGTAPSRMITPTSSVRTLLPLRGVAEHAAAFALALPDDVVFSHLTAARLWGLPLPRVLGEGPGLHVMRTTARPPIERSGCIHHRGLERRAIAEINGLRVTSLRDTWCDLIEAFHASLTLSDAVMLGDATVEAIAPTRGLSEVHPQTDPASSHWWSDPATSGCRALRSVVMGRRSFRGRRRAREALTRIRPRVWSPMESYSRSVFVEVGLPEPQLNATISHEDGGGFIAIGDLVWRGRRYRRKVVGEYNGATHEQGPSRQADHARRLLLEDAGWSVLEIYARDVLTAGGRFALVNRLWRLLDVPGSPWQT